MRNKYENIPEYVNKFKSALVENNFSSDIIENFLKFNLLIQNIENKLKNTSFKKNIFNFKYRLDEEIVDSLLEFYELHSKFLDILYEYEIDMINNECAINELSKVLKKYLSSYEINLVDMLCYEKDENGNIEIFDGEELCFTINNSKSLIEYIHKFYEIK